jgi:hypothetical protein
VHDSVAHSQMKGSFSTSSYLPAAVAIFSFASLNVESLRAIRSSLDCMPQLIHFGRQEKTFVPKGTAQTSPPHASPPAVRLRAPVRHAARQRRSPYRCG